MTDTTSATRYSVPWVPPRPSAATRQPGLQSRTSFRGAVVCARQNQALVFDSLLERNFALILMADRRVRHIWDQPEAVPYVDLQGRKRHHTFDFLVTLDCGRRVAIEVKPEARLASSGIQDVVNRIAASGAGRRFADCFVIRTERQITRDRAFNAQLILRSRKLRNEDDIRALAQIVAKLKGAVNCGALLERFRTDGRGFNAFVVLIDGGVLRLVDSSRIDRDCLVENTGAGL